MYKLSLLWSVIHCQLTFEWHSGRGLEASFNKLLVVYRFLICYEMTPMTSSFA